MTMTIATVMPQFEGSVINYAPRDSNSDVYGTGVTYKL